MFTLSRRQFLCITAGACATATGRARANAPVRLRSLQLVVPTPPGTQPDLIARWLSEPLAQRAGVPVVVLNRPGAGGAIAADAVLAAAPETGTLLLGGLDHVAYAHVTSNRRALDPFVDFVPVGAVNRDTWLLVVPAEHPARSVRALIDTARSAGPLAYPSMGEGTTPHLVTARLCRTLGIDAQAVPYRDSYLPDLLAGRLQFAVLPTPAVIGQITGGRLRALASLTDERLPQLDAVPSIRELGWPDQVFQGGLFLFAPAALGHLATSLNAWLVEALKLPEIAQRYRDASIEPTPLALEQVRQSVADRLRISDAMRQQVLGRAR